MYGTTYEPYRPGPGRYVSLVCAALAEALGALGTSSPSTNVVEPRPWCEYGEDAAYSRNFLVHTEGVRHRADLIVCQSWRGHESVASVLVKFD